MPDFTAAVAAGGGIMQDPRSHTCCFSGYRPGKMPFNVYDPAAVRALEILLDRAIDRAVAEGYDSFWSGMALGFDIWAAEAVIRAKKRHNVRLLCAIPHEHQSDRYPPDWKKRYNVCLVHSDGVHIFAPQYFTGCFAVRNRCLLPAPQLLRRPERRHRTDRFLRRKAARPDGQSR